MSLNNGFASHNNGRTTWSAPTWAAITLDGETLTDAAWKEKRRKVVTASDLPRIALGGSLKLYYQKRGDIPPDPETEQMWWGKYMEPGILERWCMITGDVIPEGCRQVWVTSREIPYLGATLDAMTIDGELREFKAVGAWGQDDDAPILRFDDINPPAYWIIQAHGQMICTNMREVRFGVFFGPELALKECTVRRNDELCKHLINLAGDFYEGLVNGRQPTEFQPGDDKILSAVHARNVTGPPLSWHDNPEMSEVVRRFFEAREAKKVWEKAYEVSRAAILSAMEGSTKAFCPGFAITRSVAKNNATRIDVKCLNVPAEVSQADAA